MTEPGAADPPPMTPAEARASADKHIAARGAPVAPGGPEAPPTWTPEAHGLAVARYAARRSPVVAVVSPLLRPDAPTPRAYRARADAPGQTISAADVVAAVEAARAATARYHAATPPHPCAEPAPVVLPDVPDLVPEADAAADARAALRRIAALIPAARELDRLLAGQPADIAARARRAIARV